MHARYHMRDSLQMLDALTACTRILTCYLHLLPNFLISVLSLDDVEIAVFERVQFSLREFDITFVYKDYKRPVQHISVIPMASLETVKQWLVGCTGFTCLCVCVCVCCSVMFCSLWYCVFCFR
jgi:hypothetical protein